MDAIYTVMSCLVVITLISFLMSDIAKEKCKNTLAIVTTVIGVVSAVMAMMFAIAQ